MPWNGSGSFIRTNGVFNGATVWDQSAVAGRLIFSDDHDIHDEDIATGLENAITRDGQNQPTGDLPMGGNKHTNVGNATARDQYAVTGQVQDNAYNYAKSVGGTADAITITVSPAISAYVEGQIFIFKPSADNTGAATLQVSGLTATPIKLFGEDLRAGDLKAANASAVFYDGASFELLDVQVFTTEGDIAVGDSSGLPARLPIGSAGQSLVSNGTTATWAETPLPSEYIYGLELKNNGTLPNTDIDVSAGGTRSDDNTANITLASSLTKKINANFAEGNNQGGLDTGSVAANTNYHTFGIAKPDGTSDILFSASKTSPTLPSGFTVKRRIGTFRTDGSSNIIQDQFVQVTENGEETTVEITFSGSTSTTITALLQDDVTSFVIASKTVSSNVTQDPPQYRLGPTAGAVSTGYTGSIMSVSSTTGSQADPNGFSISRTTVYVADTPIDGIMHFEKSEDGNYWLSTGQHSDGSRYAANSGGISLAGALAVVEISTEDGTANVAGTVSLRAKNYN